MSADTHAARSQIRPEPGMGSSANQIKGHDGKCRENGLDISLAARPTHFGVSAMHPVQEL